MVRRLPGFAFVTTMAVLLFIIGYAAVAGWRLVPVLSASMEPRLSPGDLVVARPAAPVDLKPGDVVVYEAPLDGNPFVIHRIVGIGSEGSSATLTTKGDANPAVDPWAASTAGQTVLEPTTTIPFAGRGLEGLQKLGHEGIIGLSGLGVSTFLLLGRIWRRPVSTSVDELRLVHSDT